MTNVTYETNLGSNIYNRENNHQKNSYSNFSNSTYDYVPNRQPVGTQHTNIINSNT